MDAYQKNLPKYLENGKDTLFTKEDEWEVPPVSTELRIFGSKKDNTTPQVVDAIKRVAGEGDAVDARNARRAGIMREIEIADAMQGNKRGVPYADRGEVDVQGIYEAGQYYDKSKEYPTGDYQIDELTGEITPTWAGSGDTKIPVEVPSFQGYTPKAGDYFGGIQGRGWKATSEAEPYKQYREGVILEREGKRLVMTRGEYEKSGIKKYVEDNFYFDEDKNVLLPKDEKKGKK